ncbi:uroporphyrinogen-III synthase HemD family protein [Acinetobacter baumannii 1042969-1265]|nr:uroporphyrinogen-III synthase HemD family protein [Acinetobacter baumannii 1042969-1265]
MLFINTRPDSRAAELTHALQNKGFQVESLPLLELVAQPFSESLSQLYQQLTGAQAIVVVSPTAVDVGMQYLTQSGLKIDELKHIQWIAVGQATANRLHTMGLKRMFLRLKLPRECLTCLFFIICKNQVVWLFGEGKAAVNL